MPARNHLLKLLDAYKPSDEGQRETKEEIINFIKENPQCFSRNLESGHLTGSSFLLNNQLDEVLLTHHKKIGQWLQLGGHADGDPDIFAVALREAFEESGINDITPLSYDIFDVDIHRIDQHKDTPAHFHYDIRFIFRANNTSYQVSAESNDLAWLPVRQVALWGHSDPSLARMAQKWLDTLSSNLL